MTTKHTKCPWHIEGDDSEGGIPFIQISRAVPDGPDAKFIAKIDCSLEERTDNWFLSGEDKANAHLIAAAPELLECLEKLLFQTRHGAGLETRYQLEDRIEKIIAKAKGEE